jgi:hypothetical protein
MNGDTFTADDVVFYGPPPGLISIDRVEEVAGSGGTQFDVIFATPQTELGAYTMFIGQDIYDIWGNPLDNNNNNLIAGEVEDSYTFSFNLANTRVLEDFESGNLSRYTAVGGSPSAQVTAGAAHDGLLGMSDADGGDWLYRNDVDARVSQGDIISVWVRTTLTDGRAYFGFGASATGTYSLVLAPNTGEFIIQNNPNYTFTNLAAVPQTYQANRWYRLEVTWGVGGNITGRLYDSDGTTLLNTVSANNNTITSGGIAFRAIFSNKDWDTVTAVPGAGPRPGSGQPGLDAPANAGSILAALPTLDGQVPLTAAVPQASPDHARGDLSAADAYAVSAALSEMSLDLTNREVRRAAVTTLFEQPITFEL